MAVPSDELLRMSGSNGTIAVDTLPYSENINRLTTCRKKLALTQNRG